jgi:energy-coupling factor transport system ATP-binding protein
VPAAELQTALAFSVDAGRCLAVSGPNGVGKSTLGLTLAGLIAPTSGRVDASPVADGLTADPVRWRSRELVTRIGTVFQDPEHQFVASTVAEELAVGAVATGMPASDSRARIDELLDRLRLRSLAGANPYTLSGGEKRRLSVATVLVTRPRVLVLDEPTFGQDSRTWAELVSLLHELLEAGTGIVTVSHDRHLIDSLADEELSLLGPAPVAV